MLLAAFAVLAFLLALASDYLETRYVRAVNTHVTTGDTRAAEAAARCSVAMWAVGVVGLMACVKVSWLLLLPEGAGLYLGTRMALREKK